MGCSTPGFPILQQLSELTQTFIHQVSDAIQSSHPVDPYSSCLQSFSVYFGFPSIFWDFCVCLADILLRFLQQKQKGGSVQFSRSVVSNSLWPHEPLHARPPCPSSTHRVHPNPCPLSQWCHPTISSSVVPFSSCPQSFPASGSFPVSQLFTSGGQRIGVSASTPILPMNTQDWSPLGWAGWISLLSKGLSRVFFSTTVQKQQFFSAQIPL